MPAMFWIAVYVLIKLALVACAAPIPDDHELHDEHVEEYWEERAKLGPHGNYGFELDLEYRRAPGSPE